METGHYLIHTGSAEARPPELLSLLALADPNPDAVEDYLARGRWYGLRTAQRLVGAAVLVPRSPRSIELVNLAVEPASQGRGLGRALLAHVIDVARNDGYATLDVSTGNSSLGPLALYQKLGFRIVGVTPDHFTRHYPEPIIENGIRCRDQIHLSLYLRDEEPS